MSNGSTLSTSGGLVKPASLLPLTLLGALLALTLFLSLRDFYSFQFGYASDSVEYTLLAHALVQGPVYALNYSPTAPEATHFPFGYPLLLLPFTLFAPRNFELPAVLSLIATLISVAILFLGWRTLVPEVNPRWRYPISAMVALAPLTISQARFILSDAVYLTSFLLALFFASRTIRAPARRTLWILLGVTSFFMIFTRTIGLVMFGALLPFLVVRLHRVVWRGLAWTLGTMLLLIAVVLVLTPVTPLDLIPQEYFQAFVSFGPLRPINPISSHVTPVPTPDPSIAAETSPTPSLLPIPGVRVDVGFILDHIFDDLRRTLLLTGGGDTETRFAASLGAPWLADLPALLALGLVLLGGVRWALLSKRAPYPPLSPFFFLGATYFVIVFFWRGGGDRIWYPIQPQLYLALGLGVLTGFDPLRRGLAHLAGLNLTRRILLPLFVGLVALWLGLAIYRDFNILSSSQDVRDLTNRVRAFDAFITPDAVVGSDWPTYDFIYNGHILNDIPSASSTDEFSSKLQSKHINYLILASDESFTSYGPARRNSRVRAAAPYLTDMLARGALTRIYSDSEPLQILRVESTQP